MFDLLKQLAPIIAPAAAALLAYINKRKPSRRFRTQIAHALANGSGKQIEAFLIEIQKLRGEIRDKERQGEVAEIRYQALLGVNEELEKQIARYERIMLSRKARRLKIFEMENENEDNEG